MRNPQKVWSVFFTIAFFALGTSLLLGQTTTAIISGTVVDETGGVLPGVEVSVTNVETGITRDSVSDDEGRYRVPQLPPGDYEVSGSLTGFQTIVRSGITLTVGRHAQVELALRVGEISERVTVTGEAALVETTTSAMSGLVDEQQIRDLPLNGRNFLQLTLLEPGVVHARSSSTNSAVNGGGLKMSIHGARMDYNSFVMDGTTIQSINQQAVGGASGDAMGVETIQEFQVLTSNFSAEFGGAGGGIINVVTKSGTNEVHGSVFHFHRNDNLDATNFFVNQRNQEKPEFKRNQFGFTLGGPLVADRTFLFGGYEGLREGLGQSVTANVPTALARTGVLPSGTVTVDPVILPYLALYPAGNGSFNADGFTRDFDSVGTRIAKSDFYNIRLDHNLTDASSIYGRYTIDDSKLTEVRPIPTWLPFNTVRAQYFTLEEKTIFSPTLLNVIRIGFNRTRVAYIQEPLDDRVFDPSLWYISNPNVPGLGGFNVGPLGSAGGAINRPKIRLNNNFQYGDTVSYNRGDHSLKLGVDAQRVQTNEFDTFRGMGQFTFNSLEDFLTNAPDSFIGVSDDSTYNRGYRQTQFALFAQDDFQLRSNITLNLGLRWEFITSPTEVNGRAAHMNIPILDTTTITGNPLMILPKDNFAPRVGIAWDPFSDGKTSIRIGAGMFHQMIYRNFFFSTRLLPPFTVTFTGEEPDLTFPHPLEGIDPSTALQSVEPASYENNHLPYMVQYNLSIQRELLPGTVLMVGYVGSRGQHMGRFRDPNNAIPEICPCADDPGTPLDESTLAAGSKYFTSGLSRRNSRFGRIRFKPLEAASWYNALQVKFTRRMSQGLNLQTSYTWSHSNDNGSGQLAGDFPNNNVLPQDPYDLTTEWGRSSFDLTQVLVINFNYDLPRLDLTGAGGKLLNGWQLSGILNVTDGVPFTAENRGDRDRDRARSASRPNLVPGASNNPVLGGPDQYFDIRAFELQPIGTYGNVGKNTIIGPGLATFDFALKKQTALSEEADLEFRLELFNITNRANFPIPSGTIITGSGGGTGNYRASGAEINRTNTPNRQIQLGLKISF